MKALSVRQPWAWLIVGGFKDIENRTWTPRSTTVQDPLVIHASKAHDRAGEAWVRKHFPRIQVPGGLAHGALVGMAYLVGWCRDHSSPWAEAGLWHWILADPIKFTEPRPWPGELGLFEVPANVIRDLI